VGFLRVLIATPILSCLAWGSAIDWSQPRVPGVLLASPIVWDSPSAAEAYLENEAVPIAFDRTLDFVTLSVDDNRIQTAYQGLVDSGAFNYVEPDFIGTPAPDAPEPGTWISLGAGLLLLELINRKTR
jgi:hypothetical protein